MNRSEGLEKATAHDAGSTREEPLLPREELLEITLEEAPVGLAFFDTVGRFVFANAYFARIAGRTAGELLGQRPAERLAAALGTDTAREVGAQVERSLRTGENLTARGRALPAHDESDEAHTFEWTSCRATDRAGSVLGVVLTALDVSDRVRTERERQRLLEGERALRRVTETVAGLFTVDEVVRELATQALAGAAADGVFVERLDTEGGDVEIVAAAGRCTPEVGTRVPYAGSLSERVRERAEPLSILELVQASSTLPKYLLRACGDGAALVVHLSDAGGASGALVLLREPGRPAFRADAIDRAGTLAGLAALGFRKIHLLEAAERQRDELQQVMASRDHLIQGFTHDLRNPLGAALLHLQVLETSEGLSQQQGATVSRIHKALQSAIKLADDMVKLALADAGRMSFELGVVDMRAAVQEVEEVFRARAAEKGVRVSLELPGRLAAIETDPDRVHQILTNLLANAVKFTDQGEIALRVLVREGSWAGDATPPGRWVCVEVSDTGPGITENQQPLVFKEFTRLVPAKSDGSGLGLAVSRRIARVLGGEITLASEPGRGSTFTLWLPLREVQRTPRAGTAGEPSS